MEATPFLKDPTALEEGYSSPADQMLSVERPVHDLEAAQCLEDPTG